VTSDLVLIEASFLEGVNLLSVFQVKVMIGIHPCSCDLVIGEAQMLSYTGLFHIGAISVCILIINLRVALRY
jgi:hypothetical protein